MRKNIFALTCVVLILLLAGCKKQTVETLETTLVTTTPVALTEPTEQETKVPIYTTEATENANVEIEETAETKHAVIETYPKETVDWGLDTLPEMPVTSFDDETVETTVPTETAPLVPTFPVETEPVETQENVLPESTDIYFEELPPLLETTESPETIPDPSENETNKDDSNELPEDSVEIEFE